MKPTIKYYLNGEYHEATVKDVGDITKLTTAVKTDLVSAINAIAAGGVGGGLTPEMEAKINGMDERITGIANGGLNAAQILEIQTTIAATRAEIDAALGGELTALRGTYDQKFVDITTDYDSKVNAVKGQAEALSLDLTATKASLKTTSDKLNATDLNVTSVTTKVDKVAGDLLSKVESTKFDLLEATVTSNETAISQNKTDIGLKANQSSLDLATGRITDAEANITLNAQGITSAVKRDEMIEELDKLDMYAPNLLRHTRNWDKWTSTSAPNAYVLSTTYQHTQIQEQKGSNSYLKNDLTDLVVGQTYNASVWAKSNKTTAQVQFATGTATQVVMSKANGDSNLSATWARYSASFVATAATMSVGFKTTGAIATDATQYAGGKVEKGTKNTGWKDHVEDVLKKVESAESVINQQADQITAVVKKQTETDGVVSGQATEINQMSDKIQLQATSITNIQGDLTAKQAAIELNSGNILLKVEQTDIDKSISDVSLDNRNVILNGDFARNKDDWTNVNTGFVIVPKSDHNQLKVTRTGLTGNLVIGAETNKFEAKKGDKLTISMNITIDNLAAYDVKTVAVLEMFDIADIRVATKELNLPDFDNTLKNGVEDRISIQHIVDRADVSKARLRLTLYKNGSVSYSKVAVRKGDIKSKGWEPAPEDERLIQASLKTSIDQNASQIALKAEGAAVNALTGRMEAAEGSITVTKDAITTEANKIIAMDGVVKSNTASIETNATAITSKVTAAQVDDLVGAKGYATQSEVTQTADAINSRVGDFEQKLDGAQMVDKTEILSGTEIYTDKADDAVVHVDVDGKSVGGGSGKNLLSNNFSAFVGGQTTVTETKDGIKAQGNSTANPSWPRLYNRSIRKVQLDPTKQYTVSFEVKSSVAARRGFGIKSGDGLESILSSYVDATMEWKKASATIPVGAIITQKMDFEIYAGSTTGDTTSWIELRNLQLEEGTVATPYEPPAPSPDYPIPIESLNNFDVVSSVGKRNLLLNGGEERTSTSEYVQYANIAPIFDKYGVGRYTFSFDLKSAKAGNINVYSEDRANSDIKYKFKANAITVTTEYQRYSMTVDITMNNPLASITSLAFFGQYDSGVIPSIKNVKIEHDSKATPYAPVPEDIPYDTAQDGVYKTNILLDEPLRSVGDVKDKVFRDSDGIWKVERNVGEYVLGGRETVTLSTGGTDTIAFWYLLANFKTYLPAGDRFDKTKITHFSNKQVFVGDNEGSMVNQLGRLYVRIKKDRLVASDVSGFKKWLETNKPKVVYEKESTTETLSDSMQTKLNNIASFKGENYVYTMLDKSDILSPELHATFKSEAWNRNFRVQEGLDTTSGLLGDITDRVAMAEQKITKDAITNTVVGSTKYITDLSSKSGVLEAQGYANAAETKAKTHADNVVAPIATRLSAAEQKITAEAITSTVTSSTKYTGDLNAKSSKTEAQGYANTAKADAIAGAKGYTDGLVSPLATRVSAAEQKITDDAIRSTVTSSTTFKDVQSKANSAKETLDSKSGTWDAKIDSSNAEQIAEQKAQEAKSKNYGYRYYEKIVIHGDSDNYYPVIIKAGDQNIKRDILVRRGYSEQAPPDWYSSTHMGGLTLKIKTNFGGWGGANYSWEIHELEEMYSRTFAGAQNVMSNQAFAIFLRGGGTTGAAYHLYSDQSLTANRYPNSPDGQIPSSPQVALNGEWIGYNNETHNWRAPSYRTLSASDEEEIRRRMFIKLSQETDSEVNNLKNTTIPQLAIRVNTAEQKITDSAIVSTVTQSATYKNELTGKVSTTELISKIEQEAAKVKIQAKSIDLVGAVTISSFDTSTKSKVENAVNSSQVATQVNTSILADKKILDTRSTNQTPAWYFSTYPSQQVREFKQRATLGWKGKETYGVCVTDVPWSGNSGGHVTQTVTSGDGVFQRTGITTTWTAWTQLDIESRINNAVTTIDETGITVKDGSFYLEDDQADTKYSIVSRSNLIRDHSFELTPWSYDGGYGSPVVDVLGHVAIAPNPDPILTWKTVGAPTLHSGRNSMLHDNAMMFGLTSALVNSTNYVEQAVPVMDINHKMTFSAYFRTQSKTIFPTPAFQIKAQMYAGGDSAVTLGATLNKTFKPVTLAMGMVRFSYTIDLRDIIPAAYNNYGEVFVLLSLKTTNATLAFVDGVQAVFGSTPTHYNPEESLYEMMTGVKGNQALELRVNDVFGERLGFRELNISGDAFIDGEMPNGIKPNIPTMNASLPATSIPNGFTMSYNSAAEGYPEGYGTIANFNHGTHRNGQLFFGHGGNRLYFRGYRGDNGWSVFREIAAASTQSGKVLWEGRNLMASGTTLFPTSRLNQCINGWVLLFSKTGADYDFNYKFISKTHSDTYSGKGIWFPTLSEAGAHWSGKYLYVSDNAITGWASNTSGGREKIELRKIIAW